MGIENAYMQIAMEHEAMCKAVSKNNKAFLLGGAAMGLHDAMEIIEQECPEVKSVENQTQFKRNSNAISDIHRDVLTILDSLPVVDNYEIALEGLMNAESDDEEIDEYLEEIQDESQTHEEFIESLNKLLYLLEKKEKTK